MSKPIHAKPSLYAHYFVQLKEVALKYGYNLVLHGSLNRDLDLIAIPWQEEVRSHEEMIEEFVEAIGGDLMFANGVPRMFAKDKDWEKYKVTHHGRMQYVINLNRECKMINDVWTDPMYYIDISVIPCSSSSTKTRNPDRGNSNITPMKK
jgi:hypothetical protein